VEKNIMEQTSIYTFHKTTYHTIKQWKEKKNQKKMNTFFSNKTKYGAREVVSNTIIKPIL
jgi:hypothetical protein